MEKELERRFLEVLKQMGITPQDHTCGIQHELDEGLEALIDLFWKMDGAIHRLKAYAGIETGGQGWGKQ